MDSMGVIATLSVLVGVAWCAGINLYATVAVLGLMHRYVDGFVLPGSLAALSSDWVLWPAIALYVIEFAADKIPAVDTAWDVVHTFILVPAGAILAVMAVADVHVELQLFAGLVGGTLALGSHATKATMRVASHTTGTSPAASPALSVAEDVLVAGTLGVMIANPLLTLALALLAMVAAWFVMRSLWRVACGVWRRFRRGEPTTSGPEPAAP